MARAEKTKLMGRPATSEAIPVAEIAPPEQADIPVAELVTPESEAKHKTQEEEREVRDFAQAKALKEALLKTNEESVLIKIQEKLQSLESSHDIMEEKELLPRQIRLKTLLEQEKKDTRWYLQKFFNEEYWNQKREISEIQQQIPKIETALRELSEEIDFYKVKLKERNGG